MKSTKYSSHSERPTIRTTSSGGRFVRPSDIIRSSTGRAIIKSHASKEKAVSDNDSIENPPVKNQNK